MAGKDKLLTTVPPDNCQNISNCPPSLSFAEFVWLWNNTQNLKTPTFHLIIAHWLFDRWSVEDRRLILLAFRGSGKSTLVGLFCAWLLLCDPNIRILVLAADFALAEKMVRNTKRIIERHPFTLHMKPKPHDQWASHQFSVIRTTEWRDPSVLAKGINANITGLRADVIICDDVEVPNTCDTIEKRRNLRVKLSELEFILVPGGLQLFVGTPHTFHSIYSAMPKKEYGDDNTLLSGFSRLELPLLDSLGNSLWPDRFPPNKIEDIRVRSGQNKFESQMLLLPRLIEASRLDPTLLRIYRHELVYTEANRQAALQIGDRRVVSVSSWWDPAYGSTQKGDASVIAAVFTDDDGDYWLHRVCYLVHDRSLNDEVDEATQMCRQVILFAKALFLPSVTVETNGLGRFLPSLLRQQFATSGVACSVIEKSVSRPKDIRIADAFDAVLAAGRLHAHESILKTTFIEEMRDWQPGRKNRDDALDAVAGCLLSEPVRLSRLNGAGYQDVPRRPDWRQRSPHFQANVDFAPLSIKSESRRV